MTGVKLRLALASSLLLGASACQLVFGLDQYGPAMGGAGATSGPTTGSGVTTGPQSCCVEPSTEFTLVELTEAPGSAAPPQPCAAPKRFFGGQPPIDSCTGCACDAASASCHETAKCYTTGNCTGGVAATLTFGGPETCPLANGVASVSSCQVEAPATVTAEATPSGGALVAGPWETQYALCPVEGKPKGCETAASCPQTGASTRLCLLTANGTTACPSGFEELVKIYEGGVDQQQCACTCNTQCSFEVKFGSLCLNTSPLDPIQCTSLGNAYTYSVKPTPSATPVDGVTGNFAPSAPGTLCCRKSG